MTKTTEQSQASTVSETCTAELLLSVLREARMKLLHATSVVPSGTVWQGTIRDIRNEALRVEDIIDHVERKEFVR